MLVVVVVTFDRDRIPTSGGNPDAYLRFGLVVVFAVGVVEAVVVVGVNVVVCVVELVVVVAAVVLVVVSTVGSLLVPLATRSVTTSIWSVSK